MVYPIIEFNCWIFSMRTRGRNIRAQWIRRVCHSGTVPVDCRVGTTVHSRDDKLSIMMDPLSEF